MTERRHPRLGHNLGLLVLGHWLVLRHGLVHERGVWGWLLGHRRRGAPKVGLRLVVVLLGDLMAAGVAGTVVDGLHGVHLLHVGRLIDRLKTQNIETLLPL